MVHQLNVTGPQIRQINEIFRKLDKDGDGTISHSELTEGVLHSKGKHSAALFLLPHFTGSWAEHWLILGQAVGSCGFFRPCPGGSSSVGHQQDHSIHWRWRLRKRFVYRWRIHFAYICLLSAFPISPLNTVQMTVFTACKAGGLSFCIFLFTEFLAACYSWQESELNVIWTAFQKMDKVNLMRGNTAFSNCYMFAPGHFAFTKCSAEKRGVG